MVGPVFVRCVVDGEMKAAFATNDASFQFLIVESSLASGLTLGLAGGARQGITKIMVDHTLMYDGATSEWWPSRKSRDLETSAKETDEE